MPFTDTLRVGLAAITVGLFAGSLIAIGPPIGLGVALGVCYALVALTNLPVAIAIWVGLIWIEQLPGVNALLVAAVVLMAASWFGSLRWRREAVLDLVWRHRFLIGAVVVFLIWITASLAWAREPGLGAAELWHWYAAGAFLLVFVTTVSRGRHVVFVVWALVLGSTLAVALGLIDPGLSRGEVQVASPEGRPRLWGGGGRANSLAAGLVPAIVLAGALIACTKGKGLRAGLVVAIALLAEGLSATQSRGGLVAALGALVAALLVFRGGRTWVVLFAVLVLGIVGARLATSPEILERVKMTTEDRGSGRLDVWRAGWEVAQDAPVVGVGLGNFVAESRYRVRELHGVQRVRFTYDGLHVHNAPFEMLVHAGVIGLALLIAVVAGSVRASLRAAARFDARGERALATLSRAVVVGLAAMVTNSLFISNGHDRRLWILLALGPALLSVAARRAADHGTQRRPKAEEAWL